MAEGGPGMMWLRHWGFRSDPFRGGSGPFVRTPEHEEAVSRLVHLVENGERRAELRGSAGLGKSFALDEALRRLRRPGRRIAPVRQPADGLALLRGIADAFGQRLDPTIGRPEAIGRLLDASRVARGQGIGVVVAVDDDGLLDSAEDRRLIDRVEAIGRQAGGRFSVVVVGRGEAEGPGGWRLAVRLDPLTRTSGADYLAEKLRIAGRAAPAFADRAVLRLHALAGGVPAAIDRLAGLALRAAAIEGEPLVGAEVVEEVARECLGPPGALDPLGAPS